MNEISQKFLETKESVKNLAKRLNLDVNFIIDALKQDGFLYAGVRKKPSVIIGLKYASDEYVNNPKVTLQELEDKYNISRGLLSPYLKNYLNIKVNTRKKVKFNDAVFDSIDTEEKAYWLGFIYADGFLDSSPLIEGKKNNYQIEISLKSDDINHLKKLEVFFNYPNQVKLYNNRCRFWANSKHLWNTLYNYGCTPRKSLSLEFPNESIFKDKSLIRHFIRGYFDGDGCISYGDKEHTIVTIQLLGTEKFLNKLLTFLPKPVQNLNLHHNHNNPLEQTMLFNTACNKALLFLKFIYQNSNIYLERKFNKFCPFIE